MVKSPNKRRIRNAVRRKIFYLVSWGVMEPARRLRCFHCGKRAADYHHFKGYTKETALLVIPLCSKCHFAYDMALGMERFDLKLATEARRKKFFIVHKGHDVAYMKHATSSQLICRTCRLNAQRRRMGIPASKFRS
jgi:hypothetical protein